MVTETVSASKAIEGLLREPRLYEDFSLVSDYSADANLSLKSSSGIVLAVPISKEEAASGEIIEKAIQKALLEARYLSLVMNKVIMILRVKSIFDFVHKLLYFTIFYIVLCLFIILLLRLRTRFY